MATESGGGGRELIQEVRKGYTFFSFKKNQELKGEMCLPFLKKDTVFSKIGEWIIFFPRQNYEERVPSTVGIYNCHLSIHILLPPTPALLMGTKRLGIQIIVPIHILDGKFHGAWWKRHMWQTASPHFKCILNLVRYAYISD